LRFVLIHGGYHGAWCWERIIPELERLGHEGVAIDQPGHGSRADERDTYADRRDSILAVLQRGDVLVGHSGGGLDITIAADAAVDRVSHVCYLAAVLPLEGRLLLEATGGTVDEGTGQITSMTDETGISRVVQTRPDGCHECTDFEAAREFFYHDCDEATARWAFEHLTPQSPQFVMQKVSVPQFWEADLPRSYVVCLQDRAKPHSLSTETADRLGVKPLEIDASHSPFLSRPSELAELLAEAKTRPIGPLKPGR
jgi:pimeloyl-ACP methyl ester carboxylesterase